MDGEFGAIRSVASEILVGKTELSYIYAQPVREGRPYDVYHGTLEARPVTATTSKIVYTLFFDNSMLPDDAARERNLAQRKTTFTNALENMKILAEGGIHPTVIFADIDVRNVEDVRKRVPSLQHDRPFEVVRAGTLRD